LPFIADHFNAVRFEKCIGPIRTVDVKRDVIQLPFAPIFLVEDLEVLLVVHFNEDDPLPVFSLLGM